MYHCLQAQEEMRRMEGQDTTPAVASGNRVSCLVEMSKFEDFASVALPSSTCSRNSALYHSQWHKRNHFDGGQDAANH
jgi:hypothetical protein